MRRVAALSFLVAPLACLVLWETLVRLQVFSPMLFPSLGRVALALADTVSGSWGTTGWYSGTWTAHSLASTQRVILGFLIGGLTGVTLGLVLGMSGLLRRMIDPTLQFLRPVPIVSWIPLFIVWFGIEDRPAVILIALGTFFPTYLNTRQGVQYVDPILVRAARMLGHSGAWQIFRRVVLFSALPNIFTGLRIGLGIAWMCVVTGEMLAAKSGLGYMLWDAYSFIRPDLMIVGMISIATLGFLSDRLMLQVRHRVMAWES